MKYSTGHFSPNRCFRHAAFLLAATAMLAVVAVATASGAQAVQRRAVLVGGGPRPAGAVRAFVEWSGGARARIVIIPWASEEQAESAEALAVELRAHGAMQIESLVLDTPADAATRKSVLRDATGIFMTGGDQRRLMDVIDGAGLGDLLRERYRAGCVFAGTSAGTAAMAATMITGDGDFEVIDGSRVETRAGIGVLPAILVDQHFIRRSRQNRLIGLVLMHPALAGVGIDEGTAAFVTNERRLEVVGPGQVVVVDARRATRRTARTGADLRLHVLGNGMRFDLVTGRVLP